MAETVALTTPVVTTRNVVRITRLIVDIEARSVTVEWATNVNETGTAYYSTPAPVGSSQPTGQALIAALNTANLTANSLVKRVITRLQTDGWISAGTIGGTPD